MADGGVTDLQRVLNGTFFGEAVLAAEVATLLADERGYYVAVNDEACELTGYGREQLTSFRAGELAADERSRRIYEQLIHRRKMQGPKAVRARDGSVVFCRYWGIPTYVAHLPYFVVLLWPTARRTASTAA